MKGSKFSMYNYKLLGHREGIVGVHSPQGDKGGLLVSVSRDGRLKVWNVYDKKLLLRRVLIRGQDAPEDTGDKSEVGPLDVVESTLFSEKTVFCGYADGQIHGWNMKEGTHIYQFEGHDDRISGMTWLSPDRFISSSYDQTLIYWDAMIGSSTCVVRLDHEINPMIKSGNSLYLLLNSRELAVMDINSKVVELRVEFSDLNITCICVTSELFLFGDTYSHLYVLKLADMTKDDPKGNNLKKTRLLGHNGWILNMQVIGKYLMTCSDDKIIRVWSLPQSPIPPKVEATAIQVDELLGHKNGINCLAVANDCLFSGSYDLTIKGWPLADIDMRLKIRQKLKEEELYSIKAETYKTFLDNKKKKKKRGKSASPKSKSKSPAKKKK